MANGLSAQQASRLAIEEFQLRHGAVHAGLRAGPHARVVRLDRPGAYVLVPLRDAAGLRGIVQLDDVTGNVESSAAIRDPGSAFLLEASAALAAAQLAAPERSGWASPYLGWRPCRECPSSLSPVWVVPHAQGTLFVTQSGAVHMSLGQGRGG